MGGRAIRCGVIGCGLMGREFASAAGRWVHLRDLGFHPKIVAVCDANPEALKWFTTHVPDVELATTDYGELLDRDDVDVVYCAVPHHLHEQFYVEAIRAGKHLLGEKPFGIDKTANRSILAALDESPDVVVRCSSEFPFYPGAYKIIQFIEEGRFGRIIEVEAGFWHSSDLNPKKVMNWKRRADTNGAYGCMGDLGIHVLHIPFRFGWVPRSVRALLSNIVPRRPDKDGQMAPCDTWDNAQLACEVEANGQSFPMQLSPKRIAPGHTNTWFIRVIGTEFSAAFSTENPKRLWTLAYEPGGPQSWSATDLGYVSAYPAITGEIFEFGFPDAILQMWAAFLDEVINREAMHQPFGCVTPVETAWSHDLFTAALESQRTGQTVSVRPGGGS